MNLEKQRLTLTENEEKAMKILKAVYKNDGYCPCRLTKSEDTKCPCKEMMEDNHCHCGLFD